MRHSLFFKNTDYNFLGQIVVFDLQTSFRYVVYILFLLALCNSILLKKNVKEFFHFSGTLPKWLCFSNSAKKSKVSDVAAAFDVAQQLAKSEKKSFCDLLEEELKNVLEEIKNIEGDYEYKTLFDLGIMFFFVAAIHNIKDININLTDAEVDIVNALARFGLGAFGLRLLRRLFGHGPQSWKLRSLYNHAERLRRLMKENGCKKKQLLREN